MIDLGLLGFGQHQARLSGLEEGELPGTEEHGEGELVLVEVDGAVDVAYVDGDLADVGDGGHGGRHDNKTDRVDMGDLEVVAVNPKIGDSHPQQSHDADDDVSEQDSDHDSE